MMNMMRSILYTLVAALATHIHIQAQDLQKDMEVIKAKLTNPKTFHAKFKVDIEYNEAHLDNKGIEKLETEIKIWQGNYYYANELVSMVVNDRWTVGLYHLQKQIIYGRHNPKELQRAQKLASSKDFPVDLGKNEKVAFLGTGADGVKHYRITTGKVGPSSVDIFISSTTNFFTQIIYQYPNTKESVIKKTVTEFQTVDFDAQFTQKDFSENIFIRFTDKLEATPVEKYRAYQVMYVDPSQLKDF